MVHAAFSHGNRSWSISLRDLAIDSRMTPCSGQRPSECHPFGRPVDHHRHRPPSGTERAQAVMDATRPKAGLRDGQASTFLAQQI